MDYIKTDIEGVYILEPRLFKDPRGYFTETYNKIDFDRHIGYDINFIQDNQSMSSRGVLRGLHYQEGADSQAKLVRVIKGSVLDVAVDLRKTSPTFGKYVMVELSDENMKQLFIPRGFAHGFGTLTDDVEFLYKADNFYNQPAESSILWSDPELAIDWGVENPIIAEKDAKASLLADSDVDFEYRG
jgi:dTDP-4-dehydrorhamnose 3,5-epimerase